MRGTLSSGMPSAFAHFSAPSPYHAVASRPQRSAATSRVSAVVPRSERTQRTSDLVTTQMKVSSDTGFRSGVVTKEKR